MNNNEKFISKFKRKAEDFSDPWGDSVIGDVFMDIYEYNWTSSLCESLSFRTVHDLIITEKKH